MTTTTLHGKSSPTTGADARRAMGGASEAEKRYQAAYEAGANGVPEDEHFAGRGDVDDLERESHRSGVADRRSGRRRQRTAKAAGHARNVAAASGGYLGRAGRSVTDHLGDVPTGGGGGSWVGVAVGVLMVIGLYLLLANSNLAANLVTGLTKSVVWLVSPRTLPL